MGTYSEVKAPSNSCVYRNQIAWFPNRTETAGWRRKVETAMLPGNLDVRLILDRGASATAAVLPSELACRFNPSGDGHSYIHLGLDRDQPGWVRLELVRRELCRDR